MVEKKSLVSPDYSKLESCTKQHCSQCFVVGSCPQDFKFVNFGWIGFVDLNSETAPNCERGFETF